MLRYTMSLTFRKFAYRKCEDETLTMLQIVLLTIFASSVGVVCAGGGLGGGGRFVYDLDWFEGSEDGSSEL